MERKIDETFEFEGKTLQVKESVCVSCDGCFFNGHCEHSSNPIIGLCEKDRREDEKNVVFVEVEEQPQETEKIKERKVGEVFEYQGKKLKVVETAENFCFDCYFFNGINCQRTEREGGECSDSKRADYKPVIFVEVKEEPEKQQDEQPQEQELNLCEMLKHCPEDEPFWSPLLGDVKFHDINQKRNFIVISLESGETWDINADGTITFGDVTSPEIMLYPSREQRDWSKVKYEPKKERFDPKTLKPFDKVLIKNACGLWYCNIFSHYVEKDLAPYHCILGNTNFCIPYNDDTKHLVGTKDEAPEFYKYWED